MQANSSAAPCPCHRSNEQLQTQEQQQQAVHKLSNGSIATSPSLNDSLYEHLLNYVEAEQKLRSSDQISLRGQATEEELHQFNSKFMVRVGSVPAM